MAFGLMAFLLNFIPSIGSIVATLLPLPVVLVSPNLSTAAAVLAIAIPGTIQFLVGNVIEPKIMGDELDLHPVTILLALMIWGTLWGNVGMLLAVPITAVMKILMERGELTRPVADLFAGRLDALRRAQGWGPTQPIHNAKLHRTSDRRDLGEERGRRTRLARSKRLEAGRRPRGPVAPR